MRWGLCWRVGKLRCCVLGVVRLRKVMLWWRMLRFFWLVFILVCCLKFLCILSLIWCVCVSCCCIVRKLRSWLVRLSSVVICLCCWIFIIRVVVWSVILCLWRVRSCMISVKLRRNVIGNVRRYVLCVLVFDVFCVYCKWYGLFEVGCVVLIVWIVWWVVWLCDDLLYDDVCVVIVCVLILGLVFCDWCCVCVFDDC